MEELRSESPELMWPGNACDLWPQLAKDKLQFCRGLARSFKIFAAKKKKTLLSKWIGKTTCPHVIHGKTLLALGAALTPRGRAGGLGAGR